MIFFLRKTLLKHNSIGYSPDFEYNEGIDCIRVQYSMTYFLLTLLIRTFFNERSLRIFLVIIILDENILKNMTNFN